MIIVKKLLKQLKNKETRAYVTSTHFWGPILNWGIPLAAIADIKKEAKYISGPMTFALCMYSAIFMRFALVVVPKNRLLFSCHIVNEAAQLVQMSRYVKYHYIDNKTEQLTS